MGEYINYDGVYHENYIGEIKHGYFPIKKKAKSIPFKFQYAPKKTKVTSIPLEYIYLRNFASKKDSQ